MRMGIRGLLGVLLPACLGLGMLTAGGIASQAARQDAVAAFQHRQIDALQVVSLSVATALARNDAAQLDDLVENLTTTGRQAGLTEVVVVDPSGHVVAHTDPTRFGQLTTDAFTLRAIAAAELTTRADGSALQVGVPAVAGLRWGTVIASYDATFVYASVDQTRKVQILVVTGLAVGAWAFVALGLGRFIVRPLRELETAAKQVRAGTLDVHLTPAGANELRSLAQSFNEMSDALRAERAELERRVEERTAALRDANARLERLAVEDGLTGLLNHRRFRELLRDESTRAARLGRPFALLMLDADHFKRYNDTLGHPAGDAMLRRLAGVLRATVRASDRVARYGGEEFAVLLPETDGDTAAVIAERVRASIEESCSGGEALTGGSIAPAVTASIGVAAWPHDAPDGDALLEAADRATYAAKQGGRNRVVRHADLSPATEEA
jgi:diguanylate cyclase (GGDEF)-like protein